MKKKISAFLLAFMALTLTACGESGEKEPASHQASASAETVAADSSAAPGKAATPASEDSEKATLAKPRELLKTALSADALAAADRQIKARKAVDGLPISDVFKYAARKGLLTTNAKITQDGNPPTFAITYTVKKLKDSEGEQTATWQVAPDGKDVVPVDDRSAIAELGAQPFVYYLNSLAKMSDQPVNKRILYDPSFLSLIKVQGYPDGVAGVFKANGLKLSRDGNGTNINWYPNGTIEIDVFFDLPNSDSDPTATNLSARWRRDPGAASFEPVSGWAKNIMQDSPTLRRGG